jgi:hypothetical protein
MSAYRTLLTVLFTVCSLTLVTAQDAKAIIQKAIEAAGYPKDNKAYHETWDEKGKMTLFGQSMPYDSKWHFEAPDKFRFDMKMNMQGQNMELVFLQNGKQAKESMMGQTRMLEGEKLAETKHSCYQLWVLSLRPLVHDAGFKLTALGEGKFYDKDVVSVKVQREGQRDITLHFDKKTNLLAGCADMAKDEFQDWKEVKQESVLGDYAKGADGEMKYTSMKVYRDGTILLQSKFSNSKRSDKLQPEVFKLD